MELVRALEHRYDERMLRELGFVKAEGETNCSL